MVCVFIMVLMYGAFFLYFSLMAGTRLQGITIPRAKVSISAETCFDSKVTTYSGSIIQSFLGRCLQRFFSLELSLYFASKSISINGFPDTYPTSSTLINFPPQHITTQNNPKLQLVACMEVAKPFVSRRINSACKSTPNLTCLQVPELGHK